ncbi:class I adenylate-forming enzyme family protein [Mycobacterium asiaticum]|uniref:class I adenylate-forming enzyme family protein n=1 Tax=Mycobacterium asiaticum TaxID=1790 RepID=UPI0007EFA7EB|nr:AMP-dependent synthetase [Mycobacterium asiaticum]
MSLVELLDGLPDIAVHTLTKDFSSANLAASATELGTLLAESGLSPGQVVAAMLPNDAITVAALFGVWRADGVYTPLNPRAADQELASQLHTLRPHAVITTPGLKHRFSRFGLTLLTGTDLHWSVDSGTRQPTDPRRYDADVALLQFTSGTTGAPKPVPLRHGTVLDLIDRLLEKLRGPRSTERQGNRPPMPNLVPLSLSLWAGIYQVLFAFRAGSGVVLMERFAATDFAAMVKRYQLRSTVLPPAALTMVLHDDEVTDLSPLKIVRSITAPLSPAQARRFRAKFGVTVLNSYGQTELGGEVVGWSAADAREWGEIKLGSAGRPLPGIDVTIADDEVLVRTPTTAASRTPSAPASTSSTAPGNTFSPPRLIMSETRPSSHRKPSSSNQPRSPVWNQPSSVSLSRKAGSTLRAAVVGVPDERLGEVPWAFVVRTDPALTKSDLMSWCRDRLTPYRVPVRFVFLDRLPRNDVGKVVKRELAALAESVMS